ncbi:MAG: deoxyribose-phosphate aldolase [Treponema sp.]|jgi:deoxyribose-phosphate aldolase|nr:deoxyribose-phosphate aldolase [Treponema sp.]
MSGIKTISAEQLAAYIDHTLLKAQATRAEFEKLCAEAVRHCFASIAINPAQLVFCRKQLEGSGMRLSVCVGFPLGQNTKDMKFLEAMTAIQEGANEIDYVINITELKAKNFRYVEDEMNSIVTLCRVNHVLSKVIFENCYLSDEEKRELCRIALAVCPDFIKTSTGFGSGGATLEDVRLMKDLVGDKIKIKAAGGIRNLKTALAMLDCGAERIGSSAGVAIIEELKARPVF